MSNELDVKTAETIGHLTAQVTWIVDTLKELRAEFSSGRFASNDKLEALEKTVEEVKAELQTIKNIPHQRRGIVFGYIGMISGVVGAVAAVATIYHK